MQPRVDYAEFLEQHEHHLKAPIPPPAKRIRQVVEDRFAAGVSQASGSQAGGGSGDEGSSRGVDWVSNE